MLYTLAKSQYDRTELETLITQLQPDDALLLWQDGVLQAVKNAKLFTNRPNIFALENDVLARHLTVSVKTISLDALVKLTEDYYPQIAM